jgi:hypothetical protein
MPITVRTLAEQTSSTPADVLVLVDQLLTDGTEADTIHRGGTTDPRDVVLTDTAADVIRTQLGAKPDATLHPDSVLAIARAAKRSIPVAWDYVHELIGRQGWCKIVQDDHADRQHIVLTPTGAAQLRTRLGITPEAQD